MNLQKTGWENQMVVRRRQHVTSTTQSDSSAQHSSDFMRDIISTMDGLDSNTAEGARETGSSNNVRNDSVEGQSSPGPAQSQMKSLDQSSESPPQDGQGKGVPADQKDDVEAQATKKKNDGPKSLIAPVGAKETKQIAANKNKEKDEKPTTETNNSEAGDSEGIMAQLLARSGMIGLILSPNESGRTIKEVGTVHPETSKGNPAGLIPPQSVLAGLTLNGKAETGKGGLTQTLGQNSNKKSDLVNPQNIEVSTAKDSTQSGSGGLLKSEDTGGPENTGTVSKVREGKGNQPSIPSILTNIVSKAGELNNGRESKQNSIVLETKDSTDLKGTQKKSEGLRVEKGKIDFMDPIGAGFIKDNLRDKGDGNELGKIQTSKPSPPSFLSGKEGEKGNDDPKESLGSVHNESKSNAPNPVISARTNENLKTTLDQAVLQDKEGITNGDLSNPKGTPLTSSSETIASLGNTVAIEKAGGFRLSSFEQAKGLAGFIPPQDQPFTLKKYSPSSLEVSLEPEGLGKLNIELKVTDHHLNAQILVNDAQGKDLIEKNLPQLLNDLDRGGLQIGEFTVSLKNQGRDQNPGFFNQPDSRGQPVTTLESGARILTQSDDHLVHIVI